MLKDVLQEQPVQKVSFLGQSFTAIDLSQTLSNRTSEVEIMPHHIEYIDHAETAKIAEQRLGIGPDYWRNGLGWSQENVSLTSHSGTHVDAPFHYAPEMADGTASRTIDHVPLDWLMADGILLDMRHCDQTDGVRRDDVERELELIGAEITENCAVLIRTEASKLFGEPGYDQCHIGMREDATRMLLERGAKLLGIDAWGFDRPTKMMAKEALAGDVQQLWEAHYVGAELEYAQIEKLCNLELIPCQSGFAVFALPIKLESGSAGWSRVVALVPDK